MLAPHIGRITDYHVESTLREYVGKRRMPVERPLGPFLIADQAIADLDSRFQVLQPMLVARRLQPQRQPRNFDGFQR